MDWVTYTQLIIAMVLAAAAVVLGMRFLFNAFFERDIERYKARLRGTYEQEIDSLRAELRTRAYEQEVRHASLYTRRADVLAELYGRLAKAHERFSRFIKQVTVVDRETSREQGRLVYDALHAFFNHFNEQRLFLDDELAAMIEDFYQAFLKAGIGFSYFVDDTVKEDAIEATSNTINLDIPDIRRAVELRMRRLMGD
jgi:hypothetical protein